MESPPPPVAPLAPQTIYPIFKTRSIIGSDKVLGREDAVEKASAAISVPLDLDNPSPALIHSPKAVPRAGTKRPGEELESTSGKKKYKGGSEPSPTFPQRRAHDDLYLLSGSL